MAILPFFSLPLLSFVFLFLFLFSSLYAGAYSFSLSFRDSKTSSSSLPHHYISSAPLDSLAGRRQLSPTSATLIFSCSGNQAARRLLAAVLQRPGTPAAPLGRKKLKKQLCKINYPGSLYQVNTVQNVAQSTASVKLTCAFFLFLPTCDN